MQVLTDHRDRVGMPKRWRTGQQMESRCGQSVLVGPPVDRSTGELLGRGVGHGSHRDIRFGDAAHVPQVARDTEVRQQDSAFPVFRVGEQDVGGLDVAVQQATVVRVVQRTRDRLHDGTHFVDRHALGVALLDQPRRIGALDIVHRDPQMPVEGAAVVDADDVGMPQRRREIGLPIEPFAELGIGRHRLGEDFDHVAARQPGMQRQVDLGHATGAQLPQDRVAGERRTIPHRTGIAVWLRRLGFRVRHGTHRWYPAKQLPDRHRG